MPAQAGSGVRRRGARGPLPGDGDVRRRRVGEGAGSAGERLAHPGTPVSTGALVASGAFVGSVRKYRATKASSRLASKRRLPATSSRPLGVVASPLTVGASSATSVSDMVPLVPKVPSTRPVACTA